VHPNDPDTPYCETLAMASPGALTAYLHSRGWREFGGQVGRFSLWALATDRGEAEALAPADPTLVDYPVRIRELLAALVAVEARPAAEITEDICAAVADTVRSRPLEGAFEDHTVAHDAGPRVLDSSFVLEGVVTALKHEGGQTGTVTIEAVVRGARRKVRCTLEGDAHKLAVKAYDTRGRIACAGTLTKSGAMLSLTAPTGFRLAEESK
jgi:hypothetical protein